MKVRGAGVSTFLLWVSVWSALLWCGCGEEAASVDEPMAPLEQEEAPYEEEEVWDEEDLGDDPYGDDLDMGEVTSEDLGEEPAPDLGEEPVDSMDMATPEDPREPDMPKTPTPAEPTIPRAHQIESVYMTANIGRNYKTRADVRAVFEKIKGVIGAQNGARYIGWQEIAGADPCGLCERELIPQVFSSQDSWRSAFPKGKRPDGKEEIAHLPITTKGAGTFNARALFTSPAWARISSTRFVTVSYYKDRNVSVVNAHFIVGAWSCASEVERRKRYWQDNWRVLKEEVAKEHDKGRNVIVTGDFNRPRTKNNCNPAWDPTSFHKDARLIGGVGIDYIFAVPAKAYKFVLARNANNEVKRGAIMLGIDGHKAYWVRGSFKAR